MRKNFYHTILKMALFAAAALLIAGCKSKARYYTMDGTTQGSTYHIVFRPEIASDSSFTAIRDSISLYLEQIDETLSGYNLGSMLTKFNSNVAVELNSIFIDNFKAAADMYYATEGLFDASAAPLFDIWGFGFKNGIEVTQKQIDSVLQFIGMEHFKLVTHTLPNGADSIAIEKDNPLCQLNFNAIAQGYTADYIAERMTDMGIEDFLIEIGGEVVAKGVSPRGGKWNIGIDTPSDENLASGTDIQQVISLTDAALVTSGNYRKFYMKDGKKVSHSINPRSGYPVEDKLLSATVVAENATLADGYATYLMVLGFEKAKEFLQSKKAKIEALLIYDENGKFAIWNSEGMEEFL